MRLLYIEDNKDDVILMKHKLAEDALFSCELEHRERVHDGLERLARGGIDLVLADLHLPDLQGLDTVSAVLAKAGAVPVIVVTGTYRDGALAQEAIQRGAQDYFVKGDLNGKLMIRAIQFAIERKKLERLKEGFLDTVSHELRTPLTVIRESVSQVVDGVLGQTTEQQQRVLSMTLGSADRLERLVSDLLDMSKLEAGKLVIKREPVNLIEITEAAVAGFVPAAQKKGVAIRTSCPGHCVEVYADRDKIVQVFVNLIGNALKFTKQGHIEVAISEDEQGVECRVADTGKGIAEEDLPKVFQKFEQFGRTDGPGGKSTGLGLAICKGLVELHHGRIWVTSTPNAGTTFCFTLPKHTPQSLLNDCLGERLKKARQEGSPLSLVVFRLTRIEVNGVGQQSTTLIPALAKRIKASLRRQADVAIEDTDAIYVILPETKKTDAHAVSTRLREALDQAITKAGATITADIAAFPEDGTSEDELLGRVFSKPSTPVHTSDER